MAAILETEALGFSYAYASRPVFNELDLVVREGEFVLVTGVSGSGKSTLLRLFCRLEAYNSGRILFKGKAIETYCPSELRRFIIYVPQIPSMIEGSVEENLVFAFSFRANSDLEKPSEKQLSEMLEAFYLSDVSLRYQAKKLSVGQQQRLALMRALLLEPEILLLDEPTSALDAESSAMVFSIIEELNASRAKTVVMVTHGTFVPARVKPVVYSVENMKLRSL